LFQGDVGQDRLIHSWGDGKSRLIMNLDNHSLALVILLAVGFFFENHCAGSDGVVQFYPAQRDLELVTTS